ncbi:NAD(P)-binding protein [Auricularia subglabra TFB-10046 SS5]|nr:NAD(P)-binding protein [Auricularia subglabra TFB-10046 SS5]
MAPTSFKGQTVIVTGAGSGLGRAHALAFAANGANVVVNDLNNDGARETVKEITDAGGKAVAVVASVTDGPTIVKAALDAFGGLHVLVNNAGILQNFDSMSDMPDERWDALIGVHASGTISCAEAAWPVFEKQKYGRIINTSSAAGLFGYTPNSAYSAGKAAVIGYSASLAAKGAPLGIKTNAIAPVAMTHILGQEFVSPEGLILLNPAYVSGIVLALSLPEGAPDVNGRLFESGGSWMAEIRSRKGTVAADAVSAWKDGATGQQVGEVRYDGRTVIVPGSSQAYAKEYARLGANVVVYDRDEARAKALVQEITNAGGKAVAVAGDDADAIVKEAQKAFGGVHVLVTSNVVPEGEWESAIVPHLRTVFKLTKACWPIFKEQNYGRILFQSAQAGLEGSANRFVAATHGAVLGLMRSVITEGKTTNILVNAVLSDGTPSKAHTAISFVTSERNDSIAGAITELSGDTARPVFWVRPQGHSFGREKNATAEDVIAKWDVLTNFDGELDRPTRLEESTAKMLPKEAIEAMAAAAEAVGAKGTV